MSIFFIIYIYFQLTFVPVQTIPATPLAKEESGFSNRSSIPCWPRSDSGMCVEIAGVSLCLPNLKTTSFFILKNKKRWIMQLIYLNDSDNKPLGLKNNIQEQNTSYMYLKYHLLTTDKLLCHFRELVVFWNVHVTFL